MNEIIQAFVASRQIAVVGASPDKWSFGNTAYRELKTRGYEVVAVNPKYTEVEGDRCVGQFGELPKGIESALFVLTPAMAEQAVAEAAAFGIKRIWFQQRGDYGAAVRKAQELGLVTVSRKCILMYAEPVRGGHAFHRWLAKLFGRY